jgi:hypothetical protein
MLSVAKQKFFDNANTTITPNLDTEIEFSTIEDKNITSHVKKHEKAITGNKKNLQSTFQSITQEVNKTVMSILENFNSVLNTFNIGNGDILAGLNNLTEKLSSSPSNSNPIIDSIAPAIASTTAPLKKLYQSFQS